MTNPYTNPMANPMTNPMVNPMANPISNPHKYSPYEFVACGTTVYKLKDLCFVRKNNSNQVHLARGRPFHGQYAIFNLPDLDSKFDVVTEWVDHLWNDDIFGLVKEKKGDPDSDYLVELMAALNIPPPDLDRLGQRGLFKGTLTKLQVKHSTCTLKMCKCVNGNHHGICILYDFHDEFHGNVCTCFVLNVHLLNGF